jgi:hypothetical protein
LDAHAAAKYAGVTLAIISQAVRKGALPVSTQANGAWQIDVEDLDAWIATADPRWHDTSAGDDAFRRVPTIAVSASRTLGRPASLTAEVPGAGEGDPDRGPCPGHFFGPVWRKLAAVSPLLNQWGQGLKRGGNVSTRPTDEADELERYRRASEDALEQLDWCIGYLHAIGKSAASQVLGHNRNTIRTHLLNRAAQPVPAGPTTS